jgi:hypothetical protein
MSNLEETFLAIARAGYAYAEVLPRLARTKRTRGDGWRVTNANMDARGVSIAVRYDDDAFGGPQLFTLRTWSGAWLQFAPDDVCDAIDEIWRT